MAQKVLVVDDEHAIIKVLEDRLKFYGFRVESAISGLEALEKLAAQKFDGIFLDLKMPEIDGMAVLERIREGDKETPVIVITASANRKSAIESMDKSATDFILKPFDGEQLRRKIEKAFKIKLPSSTRDL